MFIALVDIHVKPESIDAFKDLIRVNHEGSVREPGCLRFDVAQSREDPTNFVLWEWYVDEEANKSHKTTPHYLAFKERMEDLMSEPRTSTLYRGIFPESFGNG